MIARSLLDHVFLPPRNQKVKVKSRGKRLGKRIIYKNSLDNCKRKYKEKKSNSVQSFDGLAIQCRASKASPQKTQRESFMQEKRARAEIPRRSFYVQYSPMKDKKQDYEQKREQGGEIYN